MVRSGLVTELGEKVLHVSSGKARSKTSGWGLGAPGESNGRCTLILTFPALSGWIFFVEKLGNVPDGGSMLAEVVMVDAP